MAAQVPHLAIETGSQTDARTPPAAQQGSHVICSLNQEGRQGGLEVVPGGPGHRVQDSGASAGTAAAVQGLSGPGSWSRASRVGSLPDQLWTGLLQPGEARPWPGQQVGAAWAVMCGGQGQRHPESGVGHRWH